MKQTEAKEEQKKENDNDDEQEEEQQQATTIRATNTVAATIKNTAKMVFVTSWISSTK